MTNTLCVLVAALAAPAPALTPLYYPTEVGTVLVYQTGPGEFTLVVTAVEERKGERVVTLSRKGVGGGDGLIRYEVMAVSERGLFHHSSETLKLDLPSCRLKLP